MSCRTRVLYVVCGVLALGAVTAARAAVDEAAVKLVADMSRALHALDYEGTFVHLQGGTVSSMHVLHASDAGGELERMVSLDGEAREVIRDHSRVTCIWPGSDSVVVSKVRPRRLLPEVDAALARNPSYTFALAGDDRVAGRETDIVEIRPLDRFRYGYRFWIDSETRMLLRSMLLDGERAVEQVLFTSIEYPTSIDRTRFEVAPNETRMSWVEPVAARARAGGVPILEGAGATGERVDTLAKLDDSRRAAESAPFEGVPSDDTPSGDARGTRVGKAAHVRFDTLPSGYVKLSEGLRRMTPDDAPMVHVMVSDGMASVSVYVDPAAADERDANVEGLSSMGAINAFGLGLEDGFVTVVGEVPADTVRMIAESVRLLD